MKHKYFYYNNEMYLHGTTIRVKTSKIYKLSGCDKLVFVEKDSKTNECVFSSFGSSFGVKTFIIKESELHDYIEEVLCQTKVDLDFNKMETKNIDGIVNAWIWFLLICFGSLCITPSLGGLLIRFIACVIFYFWIENERNGGNA